MRGVARELRRASAVVALVASCGAPIAAAAETEAGVYFTAEYAQQQIIGGAQHLGVDMLAADLRPVASLAVGLRLEAAGWVIGGDLGYGKTDGDLTLVDAGLPLTIDYRNGAQTHLGAHFGRRIGDDWLVYGYLSEVSRDFDVTLTDGITTWQQQDEQGILRYGVGVERRFSELFAWRVTVGSARADFSGTTNMDPDREIELGLGIVLAL